MTGVWIGLVLAVVVAGTCVAVIVRLNRLVAEIKRGALRLASGDLSQRLPVVGPPELAGLAEALNRMAGQLRDRLQTVTDQRNELEAVLASMFDGVLAVDAEERLWKINPAAGALLGIEPSRAVGRSVPEAVRHPALQDFVRRALQETVPVQGEITLRGALADTERPTDAPRGPGGGMALPGVADDRHLQLLATPLRGEGGTVIGALVVLHDITRLRRLEAVRRDFVANVSHEIKTPVAAIKAAAETVQEMESVSDPEAQRFLAMVMRQADRLHALVEDLLNLARLEEGVDRQRFALTPLPIDEVVRTGVEACEAKAAARNVRLEAECPADLVVPMQPGLLENAITNLLDNGIKYSPAGGAVRLAVRTTEGEVVLEVADRGCGIEPEHLSRIFERFYRVDKARSRALGGTGLGLAIVKHVAQAHGGRVSVDSIPGQGSVFRIHLPAAGHGGDAPGADSPRLPERPYG